MALTKVKMDIPVPAWDVDADTSAHKTRVWQASELKASKPKAAPKRKESELITTSSGGGGMNLKDLKMEKVQKVQVTTIGSPSGHTSPKLAAHLTEAPAQPPAKLNKKKRKRASIDRDAESQKGGADECERLLASQSAKKSKTGIVQHSAGKIFHTF